MSNSVVYEWGDSRRFNSYSAYFRRLFGERIQKVTIDAGFTCPNRDGAVGRGGCTFCNNEAFNPSYCMPSKSVRLQIEEGIEFHGRRYARATEFLAYFQAFSNTYKPLAELREIYDHALMVPGVVGIVVGTRPDCVDEQKLDYFSELAKRYYVVLEYGVESVWDATLMRINRGHDFQAAEQAIRMTAERGIHTGAHFILGLPGEDRDMMLRQVDVINSMPLETVKFHQLQIFRNTAMALDFEARPSEYSFWSVDQYLDLMVDILQRLRGSLVVERFAGQAPERFQVPGAGNSWGNLRNERLWQMLEKRLVERDAFQGQLYRP